MIVFVYQKMNIERERQNWERKRWAERQGEGRNRWRKAPGTIKPLSSGSVLLPQLIQSAFKRPETSLLDCWLFSKYPGVASVLELALSKPLPNVSQILAFNMALTQQTCRCSTWSGFRCFTLMQAYIVLKENAPFEDSHFVEKKLKIANLWVLLISLASHPNTWLNSVGLLATRFS